MKMIKSVIWHRIADDNNSEDDEEYVGFSLKQRRHNGRSIHFI